MLVNFVAGPLAINAMGGNQNLVVQLRFGIYIIPEGFVFVYSEELIVIGNGLFSMSLLT